MMSTLSKFQNPILLLGSYIVALIYTHWDNPLPAIAFVGAFLLWVILSFPKENFQSVPKESIFWFSVLILLALALSFDRCRATHHWAMLAIHAVGVYFVLSYGNVLSEKRSSIFAPFDVFRGLIAFPVTGLADRITFIFKGIADFFKKENKKEGLRAFFVTAVAFIFFLIVASLLCKADEGFARLFDFLPDFSSSDWFLNFFIHHGFQTIFSIPVGAFLFGLLSSAKKEEGKITSHRAKVRLIRKKANVKFRTVTDTHMTVLLSLFSLLYLLFFAVQGSYLFGAFFSHLPQGFTVAEYARQGFFQLCAVATLNFLILGSVYLLPTLSLRKSKKLKTLSTIFMGESFLLALTALSKLILYISVFGFTAKRLLSFWFTLVLMAGIVLAILSIFKKYRAMEKWIWFTAASFTLLCFY